MSTTTDSLYAPRRSTAERAARQLHLGLLPPHRKPPAARSASATHSARPATASFAPATLIGRVSGLLPHTLQAVLLTLALQACVLALPWLAQRTLDLPAANASAGFATDALAIVVVSFAVGLAAIALLRSWTVLTLASVIKVQWLSNAYTHLLRLPMGYFETRGLDELASRFQSLGALHKSLSRNGVETLVDGVIAFGALVLLLFYSPMLAGIALLAVAAHAALRRVAHGAMRQALDQQLKLESQAQSLWFESARHMAAIRRCTRESGWRARWLQALVGGMNEQLAAERLQLLLAGARTVSAGVVLAAAVWLVPSAASTLSAGMLLACAGYAVLFVWRGLACVDRCAEIALLGVHAEHLGDVAQAAPLHIDAGQAALPETGVLELRNVWFRYTEHGPWVLQNVNLTVSPSECLALVGPSGSGKSTLLKIMLGLYTPQRGEVRYGGVPLAQLNMRSYRRAVAGVLQDDTLATGTLLDNITFYADGADMKRVIDCTMKASLHDDIMRLPARYNTRVGGLGDRVSSGQKQRLMLARALYQQPRVLLLDEATSQVDVITERHIHQALQATPCARVIVAHRPETTLGVPRVVVLEGGTITKDLSSVVTVTDEVQPALNDSHMGEFEPLRARV